MTVWPGCLLTDIKKTVWICWEKKPWSVSDRPQKIPHTCSENKAKARHYPGLNGGSCQGSSHRLCQDSVFTPGFQLNRRESQTKASTINCTLLNTPVCLVHWNLSNEKLRMKQTVEVREVWFMPQEVWVNSPSLKVRLKYWNHDVSIQLHRPVVALKKGPCQYTPCSLELLIRKGKIVNHLLRKREAGLISQPGPASS